VRRHARTTGGIAQFAEPVAEPGRGVGLTEVRHQERLDTDGRRRVDDLAQLRVHRDFKVRRLAAISLALIDGQDAVVNVLRPHPHHIAAPLAGVEQQQTPAAPCRR